MSSNIIHIYKHNIAPYRSDTGGFWASIDETGKYRGRRCSLQEWRKVYQTPFYQGTHPSRCPFEILSLKSRAGLDSEEYSVYWFEEANGRQ